MTAERRARLRLLLRDLGAGAAFASMAISGQLPIWSTAVFAAALLLALLKRRILAGHTGVSLAALAIAGLALYAAAATARTDLVEAACAFAGLLTAQRMLSASSPATDNQIHLTSLLMVAGGAALSGELLFAVFLFVFTVLASFALSLAVIDAAAPPGAELPLRPVMRAMSAGLVLTLAGSTAFFVLFPRLSWNVAARRVSPGLGATTGLADSVRLGGGGGSIKRNPRIVLRATLSPDPGIQSLNAYWIGRTYDTFRGDEWTGSGSARRSVVQVHLRPSGRRLIHQRIELLPAYGSRTLVALEPPVLLGNATAHGPSGSALTRLVELPGTEVRFEDRALGYSYHAYSLSGPATPPDETASPDAALLALPPTLDPRIPMLAREVVGTERNPLRAARRLEAHLKAEYRYSLELAGDVEDPLADFLFVRGQGHCEHFATALAVLLRAVGIPSRVASGFFGGERIGDEYVVRAGDAHAWTQALIPGRGFVTLDATPEAHRQGSPSPWLEWLTRQYEALDALWRSGVIDYSFRDQTRLARALVRPPRGAGGSRASLRIPGAGRAAVSLLAGLLVYVLVRRFARSRGGSRRPEATALLDDVERLLARAGVRREPGEGIEEVTARLAASEHPLAVPLGRTTRRYLEARFGQRPLREGEHAHLLRTLGAAVSRLRAPPGSPG